MDGTRTINTDPHTVASTCTRMMGSIRTMDCITMDRACTLDRPHSQVWGQLLIGSQGGRPAPRTGMGRGIRRHRHRHPVGAHLGGGCRPTPCGEATRHGGWLVSFILFHYIISWPVVLLPSLSPRAEDFSGVQPRASGVWDSDFKFFITPHNLIADPPLQI